MANDSQLARFNAEKAADQAAHDRLVLRAQAGDAAAIAELRRQPCFGAQLAREVRQRGRIHFS